MDNQIADKVAKHFTTTLIVMAAVAVGMYMYYQNSETSRQAVLVTSGAMLAVAIMMGLMAKTWLNDNLITPYKQLKDSTTQLQTSERTHQESVVELNAGINQINVLVCKLVDGDLRIELPEASPNSELAGLTNSFSKLIASIREDRYQVADAVGVLASSIEQIVKSTSASAIGASETATTVTETTIAAEEVRQTTMVATENSRFVADLAEETAKVSLEGRRATEDTVGQMTRMREQMATIADGMSGLLEKSQAIVEITSTVDDLAQQSNLLAVNAAVEAARAGELGKGFSVVAQEVKALAALSKEATAEVRRILEDIQKATAAAALSIEQGSGMVEAAVKQSSEAGNAIEALTRSVSEAASAASQIAAANQEQLVGIDQVVTAMQGIQGSMLQHADASRDIDSAAQSLNVIRDGLRILVNKYQS